MPAERVPARAMPITSASMHQAVTSSTAAQVIVTAPTLVLCRFRSVRMRARTGKAVMLMLAPRKRATDRNCMCGAALNSWPNRSRASVQPSRNGATMLTWLMTTAAWPRLRISFGSSSRPTRNRKKMTPTWLRMFRYSTALTGKMAAEALGASHPSRLGPSMMPASISPTTCGWFSLANSRPTRRLRPRMSVTCTSSRGSTSWPVPSRVSDQWFTCRPPGWSVPRPPGTCGWSGGRRTGRRGSGRRR